MCKTENEIVRYAPLCIYSFRLIAPRKLVEAQQFNRQYRRYDEISNVQDRIRWCRHNMGLLQKDVAELIGISYWDYKSLETGVVDYYPKEIVDKLAELFGIPADELLDDYNRFLYKGQGEMIQEYRERLGLNKKQFARCINIDPVTLRKWESGENRITRKLWGKYFQSKK